ncbi:hypothetical protein [Winogradskyella flava]|uniref:hypothetical protein n=1 Tax=Winogradskyella flava TaxID=1884876 RepID=UPI00249259F7|nr:hypothetical protein [Winogradskyella flava]
MNIGNLVDISDKIDSINTSESDCYKCYLNENNLLIPYVKLEIIEKNVIGNQEDKLNVEFSYLLLNGIKELNWIGEDEDRKRIVGGIKNDGNEKAELKDWFAINRENDGFEIKAIFKKLMIFIPNDSRIGTDWWSPKNTPNFPQNIKTQKVKDFFSLKNVPEQLKKVLELESYSALFFENGQNKEIKLIETNWTE